MQGCWSICLCDVNVLSTPPESGVQRKTSAVVESFSQVQKSPQIPKGESVPDFEEKLRPITAQEGTGEMHTFLSQHPENSEKAHPLLHPRICLLQITASP